MATILILDPDTQRLRTHAEVVANMGHAPIQATSGAAGIQALSEHPETTVVLCNLDIPDGRFEEFVQAVRSSAHYAIVPFVMMAETCDPSRLLSLMSGGVEGAIKLPVASDYLANTVRRGIEVYAQRHLLERRA